MWKEFLIVNAERNTLQWKTVPGSMIKDFPVEHLTSLINQIPMLLLQISRVYLLK